MGGETLEGVKVGDVLAVPSRHRQVPHLYKVDRVTKAQAFSGAARFRIKDGRKVNGGSPFHGPDYARRATVEDRNAVRRWRDAHTLAVICRSAGDLFRDYDSGTIRAAIDTLRKGEK